MVGPQTHARPGLSVCGRIDNFTIHFQPSGFHRLFGIPMTELTDAAYDAHAVIGPEIPSLEQELGDTPGFAERIQLIEERLIRMLGRHVTLDPVAIAANSLFASNGIYRVSAMATHSGLSPRQFERRFLAQVGVPPKLYARIIRFNAALDHKLRCPSHAWSRIANDQDFYDQMHLVHDCRPLQESPLHGSWRTSRACPHSTRSSRLKPPATRDERRSSVAFLLSGRARSFTIILDVTLSWTVRARLCAFRPAAIQVSPSAAYGELIMNRIVLARWLALIALSGCSHTGFCND